MKKILQLIRRLLKIGNTDRQCVPVDQRSWSEFQTWLSDFWQEYYKEQGIHLPE